MKHSSPLSSMLRLVHFSDSCNWFQTLAHFVLGKRDKYIEPGPNCYRDLQIMHKSENDAFRSKAKILLIVSLLHFR